MVVDGIMYVTNVNAAWALDAATGREIWHYERPRSKGLSGDASGGINRGVALLGDRVFMVTDNAHLLALHRLTGALLWDTQMADSNQNYGATSAPLVVKDLVISGTSGGDEGIRGFVSAYSAATGQRVWRFWTRARRRTIRPPPPGWAMPSSMAARPPGLPALTISRPIRYSGPPAIPARISTATSAGATTCIRIRCWRLIPKPARLKWHYQFTPHDLHDWDATETPMLVNAPYGGRERKLLLQGNRNGFFYVLDRTNGQFLAASPFVHSLTWASGIGADGRPILLPGSEPTAAGTRACPSMDGASNWMSTVFNPSTGMFYLLALEKCTINSKSSAVWKAGESFYGGGAREVPGETPRQYLRAMDLATGKIAWEIPQAGEGESWGGILGTSTGCSFIATSQARSRR